MDFDYQGLQIEVIMTYRGILVPEGTQRRNRLKIDASTEVVIGELFQRGNCFHSEKSSHHFTFFKIVLSHLISHRKTFSLITVIKCAAHRK